VTKKKTLKKVLLIALFALLLFVAVAFLLASMRPAEYSPYQLENADQKRVAEIFGGNLLRLLSEFEKIEAISHSITEDQLNQYLASLDEIAFLRHGSRDVAKKSSQVVQAMEKAGVRGPMVKFRDGGTITIMVQSDDTRKIVSLDLALSVNDERQLLVKLTGARIGLMPIPVSLLGGTIKALKSALGKPNASTTLKQKMDVSNVMAMLICAIGAEPMDTVVKIDRKKPKALGRLEIRDSTLNLHFVPVKVKPEAVKIAPEAAGPPAPEKL
jgi:hypothetical protein